VGRRKTLSEQEELYVCWQRVARLATVDADGVPHNVPICPVLEDGKVAFATYDDKKVSNIRANPNVCLSFDVYTEIWTDLQQVMITGTASLLTDGPRFQVLRKAMFDKYLQYPTLGGGIDVGDSVIVEIEIDRVFSNLDDPRA
jgi:nitroimidazol reductase NimA-like FMN-containing flavoprotein (pyridoxamine 5'-phosphate oxidase superfamily)